MPPGVYSKLAPKLMPPPPSTLRSKVVPTQASVPVPANVVVVSRFNTPRLIPRLNEANVTPAPDSVTMTTVRSAGFWFGLRTTDSAASVSSTVRSPLTSIKVNDRLPEVTETTMLFKLRFVMLSELRLTVTSARSSTLNEAVMSEDTGPKGMNSVEMSTVTPPISTPAMSKVSSSNNSGVLAPPSNAVVFMPNCAVQALLTSYCQWRF